MEDIIILLKKIDLLFQKLLEQQSMQSVSHFQLMTAILYLLIQRVLERAIVMLIK